MSDLPNTLGEVITFVREWRPVGDSNPCRRRERAKVGPIAAFLEFENPNYLIDFI
jgi:hypothetical protein